MTQKLWTIKPHLWPQTEFFSSGGQPSRRLPWFSNNLSMVPQKEDVESGHPTETSPFHQARWFQAAVSKRWPLSTTQRTRSRLPHPWPEPSRPTRFLPFLVPDSLPGTLGYEMELGVVCFQDKRAGLEWKIINKWFSTQSWLVLSWKNHWQVSLA